ncbi:MAG: hypothetical protein ABR530_08460 [Pyrinomonadaceae bacterium]
MEAFNSSLSWIKWIFEILGYPATIIVLCGFVLTTVRYVRGAVPVGMRLGKGLSTRKIALFARDEGLATLREVVLRSSLFHEKNLRDVTDPSNFDNHEGTDFFIVYYPHWKDHIDLILGAKKDQMPLLVYCPSGADRIDCLVPHHHRRWCRT